MHYLYLKVFFANFTYRRESTYCLSILYLMTLKCYHTTASNKGTLSFAELSTESDNWLGDGYYFWQDYYFAEWWGDTFKCKEWNVSRAFDIYEAQLDFKEDDFIDTVFNEHDYYNFVNVIEKFAKKFQKQFHSIPTLEEFNLFIKKFKIWENISIIRFQDVPKNDIHVEVSGYYYKKRIQIRINKPEIVSTFVHLARKECLT